MFLMKHIENKYVLYIKFFKYVDGGLLVIDQLQWVCVPLVFIVFIHLVLVFNRSSIAVTILIRWERRWWS